MTREGSTFVRDLVLLLGLPAVLVTGVLSYCGPWTDPAWTTHPASEAKFAARERLEARARQEAVQHTRWNGLILDAPSGYVFTIREATLELLEQHPQDGHDGASWPAQMAFLRLDSLAGARFREAAANCELSPGRCWTETVGSDQVRCQRSGGVPDPAVPWTPHLECHVTPAHIRVLINAPQSSEGELLAFFRAALASRSKRDTP